MLTDRIAIGALLLLLATAHATIAQAPPEIQSITLQRLGCYISCPLYLITLRADGTFEYNGVSSVDTHDRVEGRFPKRKFVELSRRISTMGFFSTPQGFYCSGCDSEQAVIRVDSANGSKTVFFFWNDVSNPVTRLGRAVNRSANLRRFVGRHY